VPGALHRRLKSRVAIVVDDWAVLETLLRTPVAKLSRQRRGADNNLARSACKEAYNNKRQRSNTALFQSSKRPSDYQGYRVVAPDRIAVSMPILIGAAMIATAILLSTLITAVGTRYAATESQTEENLWLIDRLTGSVYKCEARERGKASCDADTATGSIGERGKREP
jgi:hypothetical protein